MERSYAHEPTGSSQNKSPKLHNKRLFLGQKTNLYSAEDRFGLYSGPEAESTWQQYGFHE
jgi:hypothetical protein